MARADKRLWVALGAIVVVVGGCVSSGANEVDLTKTVPLPEGIKACEDIYKDGAIIDPKTFGQTCSQGEEMIVPRPVELRCSDGRKLYWNRYAWGYETEAMTLVSPDEPAHEQVPFNEAVECLKDMVGDEEATLQVQMTSIFDDQYMADP